MRQIKFRAWDGIRMIYYSGKYGIGATDGPNDMLFFAEDQTTGGKLHQLMQFTGLLDKNGKEIYEGDIVQWRRHPQKTKVSEVVWDEKRSRFAFKDQDEIEKARDFWTYSSLDCNTREVIGNIYENPELVK